MSEPWECPSCGTADQHKPFCEACGAAMPVAGDGEDSALSLMLGLVCERCDAYNEPGVAACVACGASLPSVEGTGKFPALPRTPAPEPAPAPAPASPSMDATASAAAAAPPSSPSQPWMAAPTGQPLATGLALPKVDLATMATSAAPAPAATSTSAAASGCPQCGAQAAAQDRFCRNCGQRLDGTAPPSTGKIAAFKLPAPGLPSPVLNTGLMPSLGVARVADPAAPSATMIFGAATAERTAKLVLVRGQSQFGTQWRLQAAETVIGRSDGAVLFPDDQHLAHRHCRLTWRGGELWLTPEATTNGVYLRLGSPTPIGPGDELVVGAQRLRVLGDADRLLHMTSPDPSTRVLGSVVRAGPVISLMRVAPTAAEHEVFHRHQRLLTLGRNRCDVNFPRDGFVSERHAQLTRTDDGPLLLEDLHSRNGTYLRVARPARLAHGDLLLLGDKVLRVELPR